MLLRGLDLLNLVSPLITGLLLLLLASFTKTISEKSGILKIDIGIFSLQHPIPQFFVRILFVVLATLFFLIPGFRDYSGFFPERLQLGVFFDNQGLENFLKSLSTEDFRRIALNSDWKKKKTEYIVSMNAELAKVNVPFSFSEIPGQTFGRGELKFKVKMIDKWGAQLYKIVEAGGALVHTTDIPGSETRHIESRYVLNETDETLIRGSLKDVYINHGILIMPECRQLFRISPITERYYGSLIAATRIDIFPYLNISKTLYLVRQNDGSNVPLAYGTYSLP
jgi:hypothetical protein